MTSKIPASTYIGKGIMIPIGNKYTNTKVYKYMYMDRQTSTVSYYHDHVNELQELNSKYVWF